MQSVWDAKALAFLKQHYPTKGKMWCVEHLGFTESQVRYKAACLMLRIDTKGEFYRSKVAQRAKTVTGRKRPDHSKLMRQYAKENRVLQNRHGIKKMHTNVCTNCKTSFQPYLTHGRNVVGIKCCSDACVLARQKAVWKNNAHPRGMLGKTHSQATRQRLSTAFSEAWKNPNSKFNSHEFKQKQSDRNMLRHRNKEFYTYVSNPYSRAKSGWWENGEKRHFMRSSWEHNYAWYLEWLKSRNEILEWEYESDTFWFEKIKRGVRSYLPDFKVTLPDGSVEYHEVKGWLDPKSKTKLARMAKYYPTIKLILIDNEAYRAINKWGGLIPGWTQS